jgi:GAF domain-containing protein
MTEPIGDILRELRQLADTLGPALAPASGQDLLTAMVRTARAIFGAGACSLALLTDDGSELAFTTVSGRGESTVTGLRIPAARGIAGWVVMSGQAVAVTEPQRDPRFARDVAESTGYIPASILAAPVATDREILGVMEVLDRDAGRPGAEDDLELLGLFAAQAALAIEASGVFQHFGGALLRAAADGAAEGTLADALRAAAQADRGELGDQLLLAGVVAGLGGLGAAERQLAAGIIAQVTTYLRGRERPSD